MADSTKFVFGGQFISFGLLGSRITCGNHVRMESSCEKFGLPIGACAFSGREKIEFLLIKHHAIGIRCMLLFYSFAAKTILAALY